MKRTHLELVWNRGGYWQGLHDTKCIPMHGSWYDYITIW